MQIGAVLRSPVHRAAPPIMAAILGATIYDWFHRRNWLRIARGGLRMGTGTVLGTDGPRAAHLLVSPQSNSVHQPVREPTEPTDASACGAYESSDRRQRFPSAFRRTVAS